ncbi:plasmid recombination protein [Burkholderia multivorans]|uniref:plasmid recombination protein n=1 Tax=Burkholderia multivorans TaxID=87883 RepID=UPI001C213E24|nr:plasmid recombination protein [Burkholderia multivorans]MBU9651086.1 plasmid recombination protein [Burkholderia multivorans]
MMVFHESMTQAVGGKGLPSVCGISARREAFNVMLSIRRGTNRVAVTDAARAFVRDELGEQRDYAFAAHDDEVHPHVHLVVLEGGQMAAGSIHARPTCSDGASGSRRRCAIAASKRMRRTWRDPAI